MQVESYVSHTALLDIVGRNSRRNALRNQIVPQMVSSKYVAPLAAQEFEAIGARLGMSGHEVEILIQEGIASDAIAVQAALDKFLFLAKMVSDGHQLAEYNARVNHARIIHNQREKERREFFDSRSKPTNDKICAQLKDLEEQSRRRWIKQLDAFVLALDRYNSHGVMCATDLALWNSLKAANYTLEVAGLWKIKYSELQVISLDQLTTILTQVDHRLIAADF